MERRKEELRDFEKINFGGALASGSRDVKSRPAQRGWRGMAQFDEKDLQCSDFDLCLIRLQVGIQFRQLRFSFAIPVDHRTSS